MASIPTANPAAAGGSGDGALAAVPVDLWAGDGTGVNEKLAAGEIGDGVASESDMVKEGGLGGGGSEFADEKIDADTGVGEIGATAAEENERDSGLDLGDGFGAEDKEGDGVEFEFEMTDNLNGQSFEMSELEVAGNGGSEVADMMDKDGDSVMYGSKLETIQSDLFWRDNAGAGSDAEEKGDAGTAMGGDTQDTGDAEDTKDSVFVLDDFSPKEVVQGTQQEDVNRLFEDAMTDGGNDEDMKDSVFVLHGFSPMEVVQGTQQEDVNRLFEDAMTDCGNAMQVGEPEEAVVMPHASDVKNDSSDRYYMPFKDEAAAFSTSDLVWGKIRSHPWWPGQIFEPSEASEMAMKHKNKGKYLIAYFGDGSFAWNEKRQLKPFFTHFPKMKKQSNLESFTNAVDDALEEVARRVELGLTCSCFADEACAAMKCKTAVNAGLREGTASAAADRSLIGNSFEPGKLLHFVNALAVDPYGGADRLELVTLEAQLNAFYRFKGYPRLPGTMGLVEDNVEASDSSRKEFEEDATDPSTLTSSAASSGKRKGRGRGSSSIKRKRISKDGRKEKKLSDLTEENDATYTVSGIRRGSRGRPVSRSSSRKHKAADQSDTPDAGESKKKRLDSLGDIEAKAPSPSAVKIGKRIGRTTSKMSKMIGCPIIKQNGETKGSGSKRGTPEVYSSLSEVLSELRLLASDPMRGHSFVPTLISFLNGFGASNGSKDEKPVVTVGRKRGRRKSTNAVSAAAELPVQDSYWSDVIFDESSEEESSSSEDKKKRKSRSRQRKKIKSGGKELTLPLNTLLDAGQSLQIGSEIPCTQQELAEQRAANDSGDKVVEEYTPTALILSFTELDTLPSGIDLVNIFSPFGPLEEAETEVLNEEKRAKVVFRKCSDAETAYNNARHCSLFGPALVSYRLKYQSVPEVPLHIKRQDDGAFPDGSVNAILSDAGLVSDDTRVDNT